MEVISLAIKSLRLRKLSVFLTITSLTLSITLLLGIEKIRIGAKESFANSISQTDLIVGGRTGSTQLLLYSVFHIGNATNNLSFDTYLHFKNHPSIEWTIPYSLGDSHRGYRVVATNESFFQNYRYRGNLKVEFDEGNYSDELFDVIIGHEVAKKLSYKLSDKIIVSHGTSESALIDHSNMPFTIKGILKQTNTPIDRSVYISLEAMEAIHMDWSDGGPPLPGQESDPKAIKKEDIEVKQITTFLLRNKSRIETLNMQRLINDYEQEALSAIIPGVSLSELWESITYAENALKIISLFVLFVSLFGILIAIYLSLENRRREIAILRALGLGKIKIYFLLIFESFLITSTSCLSAIFLLYFLLFTSQPLIQKYFGLFIEIKSLSPIEISYLFLIVLFSFFIGLIPGYKAFKNTLNDGLSIKY